MDIPFTKAIVRDPARTLNKGLTEARLGKPDYELALRQHAAYVEALEACGVTVITLEADDRFPDSVFVEDVAICTPEGAIITRPGAPSRREETSLIQDEISRHFSKVCRIESPGTLDGGDILQTGSHFYIGLSNRTNAEGAAQLQSFLQEFGYTSSVVTLEEVLHLKTGVSYLGKNTLLVSGEFVDKKEFNDFRKIIVKPEEAYASNAIRVNEKVLIPEGFPDTQGQLETAGFESLTVPMSEFEKLDGGLSCLSLRF